MKTTRIVSSLAIALALAGCAEAPTIDIDAAKHAVDDARQAEAGRYAPETWNAANDLEAKLDAELEAQRQRWAPMRSYATARQLALATKDAADKSKDESVAAKEKAKTEAGTLMAQAREAYGRAHAAVATAPRGKGTEADLASMRSDAAGIEDGLQDMQRTYDAGDFLGAKAKAQAAIDASKRIESEIQEARNRRRAA